MRAQRLHQVLLSQTCRLLGELLSTALRAHARQQAARLHGLLETVTSRETRGWHLAWVTCQRRG